MKSVNYIDENYNFDYSNKLIQELVNKIQKKYNTESSIDFAIAAYFYVRDTWPYNPYSFSFIKSDWKSTNIVKRKSGHCLDKAVLLISVLRAKNIPARLGLAKVKNHIAVDSIMKRFGNDVLVPHGYVDIFLNDKWVKATPAFNKSLCEKLNVAPLDFDGINDSLFQAFDNSNTNEFMEYLEDYGTFDDVPLVYMLMLIKATYPSLQKDEIQLGSVINLSDL